jgi:hypothetical protein
MKIKEKVIEGENLVVKPETKKKIGKNSEGKRDSGNTIWGTLLVFSGLVFLFTNMGLIDPDIWGTILRFWPVLLILGGIQMMLGNSALSDLIMLGLSILTFGGILLKALVDIRSPLIEMWGLTSLPWIEWLRSVRWR